MMKKVMSYIITIMVCLSFLACAEKVQAESPVVDKWNVYMQDILELEMDPVTGAQPKLESVFRLE